LAYLSEIDYVPLFFINWDPCESNPLQLVQFLLSGAFELSVLLYLLVHGLVEYSAGEHEGELEIEIHVFREGSLVEINGVASSVAGEQRGVAPKEKNV